MYNRLIYILYYIITLIYLICIIFNLDTTLNSHIISIQTCSSYNRQLIIYYYLLVISKHNHNNKIIYIYTCMTNGDVSNYKINNLEIIFNY